MLCFGRSTLTCSLHRGRVMDTPLFITLVSVVIVGIVWATDIPTTKWMFQYPPPRRKKRLWEILKEAQDEAKSPARTYTEAFARMQERAKTCGK